MRLRRKTSPRAAPSAAADLRGELERLGFAPNDAGALAERLLGLARALPAREVRALVDGVATGAGASTPKAPELHRLLEDFASELKKLDEGLRVLTAYLSRLRDHAAAEPGRTLH